MMANSVTNVIGVALAGGASARMGQSKAALEIGGEPLLRRVVERLRLALSDVIVIGSPEMQSLAPDAPVIPDLQNGLGPLGGLETALEAVSTRGGVYAFVVACDMPFLSPPLIRYMAPLTGTTPAEDAVVLRTARGVEYLHALYSVACLPAIREQLAAGKGSLRRLYERLSVREVSEEEAAALDPRGLSAFNANTPDEWEQALELAQLGE